MVNYQIALTNAIFDDTYRNVLRFDTRAEQEAYFNVNTLLVNAPLCNFAVGSLYASRVVVDYKDATTIDLNEFMNNNYCIVKDNTPGATLKYYYYFVKNAQQDNANRLVCDLELDVYQTYYIDLTFGDCAILRAHLNRFIDNGDNTVSFDATPNSKLFEREEIQDIPKRLVARHRVNSGNSFVDDNIICWLYIYLDPNHEFTFYSIPDGQKYTRKPPRLTINGIPSNIGCLAVPVINTTNDMIEIHVNTNTGVRELRLGHVDEFLKRFEELNNGYQFVYSIKLSLMPPSVYFSDIQSEYTLTYPGTDNLLVPREFGNGYLVSVSYTGDQFIQYAGILLFGMKLDGATAVEYGNVNITRQIKFAKNEIVGADANAKFNPKLNNNDYYELNLVDLAGNSFTYDLQKFNDSNLTVLMTEPLTPDYTKNYCRFLPPQFNTQYIQETTGNLLGLVTSNDNTILMPTSAYQTMIANNKNYFNQNSFNAGTNFLDNITKTSVKMLGGNFVGGLTGAAIGAAVGVTDAFNDLGKAIQNKSFEIDNLRNSPSSIKAANGNFIFNAFYTKPGMYIEEYDITENSKQAIDDYMKLYGFNYNRIDNIKNVDNIRKNYNYVRAYIEEINAGLVNISNIVHNRLREIFARGVRMWNTRTFDYTKENYERWLEE